MDEWTQADADAERERLRSGPSDEGANVKRGRLDHKDTLASMQQCWMEGFLCAAYILTGRGGPWAQHMLEDYCDRNAELLKLRAGKDDEDE